MSKSLFTTLKEMKGEDKKKLLHTVVFVLSMLFFLTGFGLTMYSCKSEPKSYEAYKAETDWQSILPSSVWVRQSGSISSLESVQKIRFMSNSGSSWTVRLESSETQSDECTAEINNDTGSLDTGTISINIHLSEHEGYWLRLTSPSSEVLDFIFEN